MPEPDTDQHAPEAGSVPQGLRTAAAWSWRILVILALVIALLVVVVRLETLFVALFVALLLTALLEPGAARLTGRGVPRILATAGVLLGAVAVIVGVLYLAGRSLARQLEELSTAIVDGYNQLVQWAQTTFGFDLGAVSGSFTSWIDGLGSGETGSSLVASVFGAASTAFEVVGGAGISLFATIFFVHDGARIWQWLTHLFPSGARAHIDRAGSLSWQTLTAYARGTVIIAAIDGVGIGLGAALIGVPLAAPIGLLVFFFAFIPIVGALLSGFVAVLIALATQGVTGALLMLAVVLVVQQVEGHILQPLIQGKMVAIHPLAVVLAVAAGSIVAGIVGAIIAVPIVAVANVIVRYAHGVATGVPPDSTAEAAEDHDEFEPQVG
jgi:predicted PurR-regulated permease PerM